MIKPHATLAPIATRPLFTIQMDVNAVHAFGTDTSPRQVGMVGGGRFEGERLNGDVLPGGTDWQIILPDGTIQLDCRLMLRTDDGVQIAMRYGGMRAGSPEVLARLREGKDVDPTEYYFRINPLFETGAPGYEWLNRLVAVGTGQRLPGGPVYDVYEVL